METKNLADSHEVSVEFVQATKQNKVGDRVTMTNKAANKFIAAGFAKTIEVTKVTKAKED